MTNSSVALASTDFALPRTNLEPPNVDVASALIDATGPSSVLDPEVFCGLDWAQFECGASYHGVLPIAAHRILETGVARELSSDVRSSLRSYCHFSLTRSFPFFQEMLRIVDAFERQKIPIMPYKGPAFAEEFWGSFALRECSDLDFLTPPENVQAAGELFEELGYQRVSPMAAHLRPAMIRNASEEQFIHPETKLVVELQWAAAPPVFAVQFDTPGMWIRSRTGSINGQPITSAAPEDLLLLLVVHGWKHNWSRLIWIADFAQVLNQSQLDWDLLRKTAQRKRLAGILALALSTVEIVYGVTSPIASPERIRNLAKALVTRMRTMQPCSYVDWHRYMLATRDNHWDRARQLTRFLLTPGLGEYAACSLPAWCSPGYRAVRLARVLQLIPSKTRG